MLGGLLVGVLPRSVRGGVLPGLVIGQGLLAGLVVGHRGLLVTVDLPLLLLQKGGGGGAAAAPLVQIRIVSPIVRPPSGQLHAPPLHQHLDLGPALVIHGTLAHEASIPGPVGVLGGAVGRRAGYIQHGAGFRCDDGWRGVRRAQLRTVRSRGDHLVVFVLGILVLGPLTLQP